MRFVDSGPDIPDELLLARDEGHVLFFCGAGVSRAKANLADFLTLAGDVMDDLGSLTGSQARRLHDSAKAKSYVPVDRMFSSLDLEFDPRDVRDAVARALKPTPNVDLDAHRILIDLSRGPDGRPRLVTTNFDLLFEACDPSLATSGPPRLPMPDRPAEFEGIIHLHGRTKADYSGISDDAVILSSSDFGKAYLSEGWATHYIRQLMGRFKIVFVGYSADDPPVQYLLEALREERSDIANIYAFQYGDEAAAQELWLQKGVVPIAYGNNYDHLWDTLAAWAERAKDPDAWFQDIIHRAAAGPSAASPLLRGRIAHMASTVEGMAKLARSNPRLPSTWLYTFDPAVRYRRPGRVDRYDHRSSEIDPFEHLGLDIDSPPPPIDPDEFDNDRKVPEKAWDGLATTGRDLTAATARSAGGLSDAHGMLPRFEHLAEFIAGRMGEAPVLWWAAGRPSLHRTLKWHLDQQLMYRLRDDPGTIPRYWRFLLASWGQIETDTTQRELEIQHRAGRDGWSAGLVREAIELYEPRLTVSRDFGSAPPLATDADPEQYIRLDVEYPRPHVRFTFPAQYLPLAAVLKRALLVRAEAMETEIGAWIGLDSITPDPGGRLNESGRGLESPVIGFTHVMLELEVADPDAARREVSAWAVHEGLAFERLGIWASGRPGLIDIAQAETNFADLTDDIFWSSHHQRDLLLAIKARWHQMSAGGKSAILARILQSEVPFWKGVQLKPAERTERTAIQRLNRLSWFAENGMEFGVDVTADRTRLLKDAPDWTPRYAEHVGERRMSGVFSVTTDTDPTSILNIPINALLPLQLPPMGYRDHTELDPFAGYSIARPAHAVLALHSAMRRNVDTVWQYWSTFLRATAEQTTTYRLDSVVVCLVASLSPADISRCWYPLVEWLKPRAAAFEAAGKGAFDILWNKVLEAAALFPSGYKQKPGRDWSFEAINSVVGRLVEALLEVGLPQGQSAPPANWIDRLTKALEVPGDHGRHALCIISRNTQWFYHYEPAWTRKYLLANSTPAGPDADAFWSGLAGVTHLLPKELLSELKTAMLERVAEGGKDQDNLIAFLLAGWGDPTFGNMVSDTELRDALILGGDDVRSKVLRVIRDFCEEDAAWQDFVAPFLTKVWPRQRTSKTPAMTSALLMLATSLPKQFAKVLAIVQGRLVPLSRNDSLYLECEVTDLDEGGVEALIGALEIVLPSDRENWPYHGKQIIGDLVKAGLGTGERRDALSR